MKKSEEIEIELNEITKRSKSLKYLGNHSEELFTNKQYECTGNILCQYEWLKNGLKD